MFAPLSWQIICQIEKCCKNSCKSCTTANWRRKVYFVLCSDTVIALSNNRLLLVVLVVLLPLSLSLFLLLLPGQVILSAAMRQQDLENQMSQQLPPFTTTNTYWSRSKRRPWLSAICSFFFLPRGQRSSSTTTLFPAWLVSPWRKRRRLSCVQLQITTTTWAFCANSNYTKQHWCPHC